MVAVGRLHPQKGYDVLLDAVAGWASDDRLPTTPLVAIAGDGPLHDHLAGRIRAERLPVLLLGRRDDVADLLGAADVCVLPSRWEGTPLIAQEVLRAGRPLVATRTGGVPDLVGGAAELVPVGDAPALTDALVRVLTDPAHAAQLVEAGTAPGGPVARRGDRRPPAGRRLPRAARPVGGRPPVRPLSRAAALLAVVLMALLAWPAPAGARARPRTGGTRADRVLIVGVPGLAWSDVDPTATPALWALAERSPIGAVSVRAARSTTCLLDGWASLGAGNRAKVPAPDAASAPGHDASADPLRAAGEVADHRALPPGRDVQRTAADPDTRRYGAQPGAPGRGGRLRHGRGPGRRPGGRRPPGAPLPARVAAGRPGGSWPGCCRAARSPSSRSTS